MKTFFGLAILVVGNLVFCSGSFAQNAGACDKCGTYTDLAKGAPWYETSSNKQIYYFHLLDSLDTSNDEFNKSFDSGGSYNIATELATGHFDGSTTEAHKKEVRQKLIDLIKSSYTTSTQVKYPIDLIKGMEICHAKCLQNVNLTCSAIPRDGNTVHLNLQYTQPTDLTIPPPTYEANMSLPAGVVAVPAGSNKVLDQKVKIKAGPNPLTLDRTNKPEGFEISWKTSLGNCTATVPAQPKVVATLPYCQFDAGFNAVQHQTQAKVFSCPNMPPGSAFLAVFAGAVVTDRNQNYSWVQVMLSSPSGDLSGTPTWQAFMENNPQYPTNVVLTGVVPDHDDAALGLKKGVVDLKLDLTFCQVLNGEKISCSTRGPARLYVAAMPR